MQFQAHIIFAEWKLLQTEAPVVDRDYLATMLEGGVAGGNENCASRSYEKEIRHNYKIRQSLVE